MLSLTLAFGPWLSLRTKFHSLVLSSALRVQSLVLALVLRFKFLILSFGFVGVVHAHFLGLESQVPAPVLGLKVCVLVNLTGYEPLYSHQNRNAQEQEKQSATVMLATASIAACYRVCPAVAKTVSDERAEYATEFQLGGAAARNRR